MKVLIIKLTSMGDLMHAFPAITDAVNACPEIEFDWVVDHGFSDVPLWHPNVKNVIKTAHRQWRKAPLKAWRDGLLSDFYAQLNLHNYDVIIDLQSNIKSAVVSWLVKGDVHGLDKNSCREKPAHWAYKYQHSVNTKQHSIEKIRTLMAQALKYDMPDKRADYGVDFSAYALPRLEFKLPEKYILFIHNASWLTKLWPQSSWQDLIQYASDRGYSVLLPCGNNDEFERAQTIAKVDDQAFALPRLSLNEMAALTHHAQAAICSDTGLAHLAAVASLPTVTLYGATDTKLIGTYGQNQQHCVSDFDCSPCYKRQCSRAESHNGQPVCMDNMTADTVWHKLDTLLP